MIILDWNKNSEEVLAQGHYNTKRSVNTEQTRLCQYWQEQGVDKDRAYAIWATLNSPQVVASLCEEEKREYFEYFWGRAKLYGFNRKYIYGLTREEYLFIDNLKVDIEYKYFLKNLVEYCRSYGEEGQAVIKKQVLNFLKKQGRSHLKSEVEERYNKWNEKLKLYSVVVATSIEEEHMVTRNKIQVLFMDRTGEVVECPPFHQNKELCSVCGAEYVPNHCEKIALCPLCRRQRRNQQKNKNKR